MLPKGQSAQNRAKVTVNNSSRVAQAAQDTALTSAAFASNITVGTVPVSSIPLAGSSAPGIVQPDNTTITVDHSTGIVTVSTASSSTSGIVKPDGTIITINPVTGLITVPLSTNTVKGVSSPDNVTIIASSGILTVTGTLPHYAVASLPVVAPYTRAFATNTTLDIITGLGTAPIGGGANQVPVYSIDGTNWLIG